MRFFVRLAYNGEHFHGWQSQPNASSIQQKLEDALSIILRHPVNVVGAGRTDAGVHARTMFAHFDAPFLPEDTNKLILSLNRLLGKDIAVYEIFQVADDAHARFDAVKRTYKYFITFEKTPFLYPFCWLATSELDIDKMNEAAAALFMADDFTSFAKLHSDAKTNICNVSEAKWDVINENNSKKNEDSYNLFPGLMNNGAVFTISADRFLRNMVRSIVGTLVDVGRGKLSVAGFQDIISKKDRCSAGVSMPAHALFLWDIKYPYI